MVGCTKGRILNQSKHDTNESYRRTHRPICRPRVCTEQVYIGWEEKRTHWSRGYLGALTMLFVLQNWCNMVSRECSYHRTLVLSLWNDQPLPTVLFIYLCFIAIYFCINRLRSLCPYYRNIFSSWLTNLKSWLHTLVVQAANNIMQDMFSSPFTEMKKQSRPK